MRSLSDKNNNNQIFDFYENCQWTSQKLKGYAKIDNIYGNTSASMIKHISKYVLLLPYIINTRETRIFYLIGDITKLYSFIKGLWECVSELFFSDVSLWNQYKYFAFKIFTHIYTQTHTHTSTRTQTDTDTHYLFLKIFKKLSIFLCLKNR